jgi:hypothetical protein
MPRWRSGWGGMCTGKWGSPLRNHEPSGRHRIHSLNPGFQAWLLCRPQFPCVGYWVDPSFPVWLAGSAPSFPVWSLCQPKFPCGRWAVPGFPCAGFLGASPSIPAWSPVSTQVSLCGRWFAPGVHVWVGRFEARFPRWSLFQPKFPCVVVALIQVSACGCWAMP